MFNNVELVTSKYTNKIYWAESKDANLVDILKRAYFYMKENKTFSYKEVVNNDWVSVSFTGANLFVRIECSTIDNKFMFDKFINVILCLKTNTSDNIKNLKHHEDVLKVTAKFKKFITARFNPANLAKKIAKKLKIKKAELELSDRSSSTYIKNEKGETVLRIADHAINVGLVAGKGYNMPKFELLYSLVGLNHAFYRPDANSQSQYHNNTHRLEFTPNFID